MEDLSAKTQDYLKVIWDLHECIGEKVALGDVTERMGEKEPIASEAMKKLAIRGLVNREPYRGISLSDHERDIALIMVRRHRLTESFLVSTLGHTWDEAHEEAEKLEHAVSEEFINCTDVILGFLERDSYGDPIPSVGGTITSVVCADLTDIEVGAMVVADRINDLDPELLHYLVTSRVGPRTMLRVEATPYAGMHVFVILDEVGDIESKKIYVADLALWAIKAIPVTN